MKLKTGFLITGLLLIILANVCIVMCSSVSNNEQATSEDFVNYFLENAGGTGSAYQPMGKLDNVSTPPSTEGGSVWRYNHPNETLQGPPVTVGPDNLFILKNNKTMPECCDSSFSTDTGCVCLTPEQRQYLNQRGGNRTMEDGV